LGAGGLRFKSGRPDHLLFRLQLGVSRSSVALVGVCLDAQLADGGAPGTKHFRHGPCLRDTTTSGKWRIAIVNFA